MSVRLSLKLFLRGVEMSLCFRSYDPCYGNKVIRVGYFVKLVELNNLVYIYVQGSVAGTIEKEKVDEFFV